MRTPFRLVPPCLLAALLLLLALAACAPPRPPATAPPWTDCRQALQQQGELVAHAGVELATPAPVTGYPYLRTTRFLSALASRMTTDEQRTAWLRLAAETAVRARRTELANLPAADRERLRFMEPERQPDLLRLCTEELLATEAASPASWERIVAGAKVADDYNLLYRTLGLYPLVQLPVAYLTQKARQEFQQWFETPWERLPQEGTLTAYRPDTPAPATDIGTLLAASRHPLLPLSWPQPEQARQLALALAPTLWIDTLADYDRPGEIFGREDGWGIDLRRPTIYYYLSHTFWQGRPRLQVNYALWFRARAGASPPLIENGDLDGLTVRLTLDEDGTMLLAETMNNCGCYHLALPGPRLMPRSAPTGLKPGLFIPRSLPEGAGPLAVRVSSGWHQVQQVGRVPATTGARGYRLRPYADLESLPAGPDARISLFRPDGIARGSGRVEPLLLFGMGVHDVGSMRQRGHHPIALVGRDHFDDPDLLNRYFRPTAR